ncbi:MAG TPA: anaerobic ribonucleoside-triphosphate reductase activating protein [Firmicutes bacterium]|nr:anaerobic ribonucleoside-triphosphate reductase activating protein [Bacillota bacterium]
MEIRIAGVVKESIVDGPGIRYTVFTQGCPHHCPGCHNPQTHDFSGGTVTDTQKIAEDIAKNPLLKGVTFSGGEPFEQPEALCELAEQVRAIGKDIVIYSGYTFEQLLEKKNPAVQKLLSMAYMLVDGRFVMEEKDLTLQFRGSRNQRLIDCQKSLAAGKAIEIVI